MKCNNFENTGTVLKINVHIDPVDNRTMDDMEFSCSFFVYANRMVTIDKSAMKRVDADNYIAIVDTEKIGAGAIMCRIDAHIRDGDCPDGWRREVITAPTGITVVR